MAIDVQRLRALPGVTAVFTAADIPGVNDVGPIVHGDDPILAEGVVHYLGPVSYTHLDVYKRQPQAPRKAVAKGTAAPARCW